MGRKLQKVNIEISGLCGLGPKKVSSPALCPLLVEDKGPCVYATKPQVPDCSLRVLFCSGVMAEAEDDLTII